MSIVDCLGAKVCGLVGLAAFALAMTGARQSAAESSEAEPREAERSGPYVGMIYAMTNGDPVNSVVRFGRRANGALVRLDESNTGGKGSGIGVRLPDGQFIVTTDPLLSAHGLKLTERHDFLLAINGGDNSVSVFHVERDGGLVLRDRKGSDGSVPISIAIHQNLVYVANGGDFQNIKPNVVGFRLRADGALTEIAGSKREFVGSGSPGTARVTDALFSPRGDDLIVTDAVANEIHVFDVAKGGALGARKITKSTLTNPFGMTFVGNDVLAVTTANSSAGIGASAVSSYKLVAGSLKVIDAAEPNGQTESCWLSVTPDGRDLYSSNSPTFVNVGPVFSTISHYRVRPNGALTLVTGALDPRSANLSIGQNSAALESFIPGDGRFFYQLWAGLGEVAAYRIENDGNLVLIKGGAGVGLPLISPTGMTGF